MGLKIIFFKWKQGMIRLHGTISSLGQSDIRYLLETAQEIINGDPTIGAFFLATENSGIPETERV